MVEESERYIYFNFNRDVDIIKKKIGSDFKIFVKSTSNEHMEKLKDEMLIGFHKYYDELNKKVAEELQHQESQQNDLHGKIKNSEKKFSDLTILMERRKNIKLKVLENLGQTRRKATVFRFLVTYRNQRKNNKILKELINKIYREKQKRKCLNAIKNFSILQKTDDFDEKIRVKTEGELRSLQEDLEKQKEDLLNLILKAEEKLKHENRRKVQTKLQLDQMVLRGISALNLKALKLSQNSLNGR